MKKGIIAIIMLAGAMLVGVFIGSHLENSQPGDTKPQAETERGPEVLYWVASYRFMPIPVWMTRS
jgi:hypothetical protein